jgi:hypothetical protein
VAVAAMNRNRAAAMTAQTANKSEVISCLWEALHHLSKDEFVRGFCK